MLARVIAGADADDAQLNQARIVAEAQIDLVQIRDARRRGASESDDFSSEGNCTQEFVMTPTIEVLRQLSGLERYECRAISRRRRGMR